MKFCIKKPGNHTPIALTMIPEDLEAEHLLKAVYPKKGSITTIRKNGIWSSAAKTDLNDQLVKAISRGIHS